MTTDIIDKPKAKRKYNRSAPSKTPARKIVDLIGNHKLTPSEAARVLNVHPNSVYQALQRYKIDISAVDTETIKSQHESELIAINALARGRIFDKLLNTEKLSLIEMTAVLDRSFQQLRELQGKGHSSINIFTMIVQKADDLVLKPATVSTISSTPNPINQPVVQLAQDSTIGCQPDVT